MLRIAADYERMAEAADELKDDSVDVRRFPSGI
jgi:hypothetical protein